MHTREADLPDAGQDGVVAAARERALREVVEMLPGEAFGQFKYAEFLAERGRREEAEGRFRRALELQAEFPEALRGLAALLAGKRDFFEAVALLRRAVAIRPDDVQALCDLGNALVNIRRGREAAVYLRHALRLDAGEHRLHSNLGLAFTEAGMFEEAEGAFLEALRIKPMFVSAHNNLANLYILMGRLDQACACLDLVETIDRNNLTAKCNRAIALLAMGDYEGGWRAYQRRWERPESPHRVYAQPMWKGEALEGKRMLLHTEEGLGDRIQFIRYARLLRARGATVVCECPMPLMDVFRSAQGVDELVELGNALPAFDFHASLLNLPYFFETTPATIPAEIPYLAAEPERVTAWRERLGKMAAAGEFLIGVAWQGNPHHQWDRFRSMPLMQYEPLACIPGVRLVSLQRGPGTEQIAAFQKFTRGHLIVPTAGKQDSPADLADTAAIMASLDLIITVDTATAHLAGALGREVWVALSTVTDWRWMAQRHDSPWYPTMRLFRQKRLGEWDALIGRMGACLRAMRA